MRSSKYKNWLAVLDLKTCLECRSRHGKIYLAEEIINLEPPLHERCRCIIEWLKALYAGTVTSKGDDGADWWLKWTETLPDYYITTSEAKNKGGKEMNCSDEQKRNAFKPIVENPIVLDFTGCKYLGEIHLILKEKFGFPEYYGENWDALWDCLNDRFYESEDYIVEIYGYAQLEKPMRNHCATMLDVFDDLHKEHPNVIFKMIS